MKNTSILLVMFSTLPLCAEDWTREAKDPAKRTALHDAGQLVRGDSGKWNDAARLQHAPPLAQKPAKMSLDAWADQLLKMKFEAAKNDDHWLIFRTEQLDDNDRVWVERIERRGRKLTVVANQAKWHGKYFRNFTYYQVIAVNLGKLEPGSYETKWVLRPLTFTKFDGDGKALDTNWPRDERPADQKPTELCLTLNVGKKPS